MLAKSRLTIALLAFVALIPAANGASVAKNDFFETQRAITDGSPYPPPIAAGAEGPRGDRDRVPAEKKDFFETQRAITDGSPGEPASPSVK